jgi:predicted  nucleic acid-binding Zn-ribbon protein
MANERPPADSIDVRLQWPSAPLDHDGSDDALSASLVEQPPPAHLVPDPEMPAVEATPDVRAELDAVRSELAALRRAVAGLVARHELHELQSAVGELQGGVSVLLERPTGGSAKSVELSAIRAELATVRERLEGSVDLSEIPAELAKVREQLEGAGDLSEVRAELAAVREQLDGSGDLGEVRAELAAVRKQLEGSSSPHAPDLDPLSEELSGLREEVSGLREEVAALRRRIPVRSDRPPMHLSEDQLQQLAVEIAARLDGRQEPRARHRAR